MFTQENVEAIYEADDMIYGTGLNYILIVVNSEEDRKENIERSKFYYGLNSPCNDEDVIRFTDLLLRIMHLCSEEQGRTIDILDYSKQIMEKVYERIQQKEAEFEIDEDFN